MPSLYLDALELREKIAIAAQAAILSGSLANGVIRIDNKLQNMYAHVAKESVKYADALIAELGKKEQS